MSRSCGCLKRGEGGSKQTAKQKAAGVKLLNVEFFGMYVRFCVQGELPVICV